ncbi:putative E3 ubiquitin-protein ligase XERICO [Apium graveolens]|uniref:putative E3 ubiquitin-protein ligase XERICO n=1 Tax=Apium graveolens TaxID=4045 RepID=UPI003D7BDC79
MGLSNFHGPNDGVLPLLVLNTVLSVALLKNMLRSVLDQVVGADTYDTEDEDTCNEPSSSTRLLTTKYGSMKWEKKIIMEECCCVCLCRFKEDEDICAVRVAAGGLFMEDYLSFLLQFFMFLYEFGPTFV